MTPAAPQATFWRWKAPVYSFARRLPPFRQILASEYKNLLYLVKRFPPPQGRYLDLGSGSGDSLQLLPSARMRIALDAEFAMLVRNPALARVIARAEALPFSAHRFTFVSAIGLLEYINESDKFFEEARRVLQVGGYFLFTSSPPTVANRLRWLWGEKLYFLKGTEIKMLLEAHGWRLLGHRRSCLQAQWLARRDA
jgi:ubiquinone/menaquinone biosynthesis C-methylase UbiE